MTRHPSGLMQMTAEVERALIRSEPVVALESSVIAQGLPAEIAPVAAREAQQRVRDRGAVPATIAIIGGVHRGWEQTLDISADLTEIGRTEVCVVCSGAKSLLDIPATLEMLETRGVPVIGFRTDTFPLFYVTESSHNLADRADDAETVAAAAAAHWGFARRTGLLVVQPVAEEVALPPDETEFLVEETLAQAEAA